MAQNNHGAHFMIALLLALLTLPANANYRDTASTVSDYTLIGNGAAAFYVAAKHQSWRGVAGVALGAGSQWIVNNAVKHRELSPRPNGKDNLNFWSGHTASSMVATTVICTYEPGAPCVASAIGTVVVAAGRVVSLNHTIGAVSFAIIPGYFHGKMGIGLSGEF
jgi:hypothetical protein